jgi:hypothetical protein
MKRLVNIYPGDILSRPKKGNPLVTHFGMAIGSNNFGKFEVIENNDIYGVRIISLDEFRQDSENLFIESAGSHVNRDRRIQIAKSFLGQPYSLWNFNCEHFVNLVKTGEARSSQVVGLGILAAGTLGVIWASKRLKS